MKKCVLFIPVLCIILLPLFADARMVKLKAIGGGVYQDGQMDFQKVKFEARCNIDVEDAQVSLDNIMSEREGRMEGSMTYEIVGDLNSKGISSIFVSKNKIGQNIITAVRDIAQGGSEILIIGDDFYEFARGANGKFYLESGEVSSL